MTWEEQLGLKFTAFISGIIGGIISLTFESRLSFFRALTLILVGGITAGYAFAGAQHFYGVSTEISGFFGFTIGLVSMRLINLILSIADIIQKNPSIILSIPKIFDRLKDGLNDNSSDNRSAGNDSANIHTTGEGHSKGDSAV